MKGRAVVARLEDHSRYRHRQHDAVIDGVPTEFKSLDPGAGHATVKQAVKNAVGQAPHAVVDGRAAGLSEDDARRGLARFLGTPESQSLVSIHIPCPNLDFKVKRRGTNV